VSNIQAQALTLLNKQPSCNESGMGLQACRNRFSVHLFLASGLAFCGLEQFEEEKNLNVLYWNGFGLGLANVFLIVKRWGFNIYRKK
jgi:hypothetical protein